MEFCVWPRDAWACKHARKHVTIHTKISRCTCDRTLKPSCLAAIRFVVNGKPVGALIHYGGGVDQSGDEDVQQHGGSKSSSKASDLDGQRACGCDGNAAGACAADGSVRRHCDEANTVCDNDQLGGCNASATKSDASLPSGDCTLQSGAGVAAAGDGHKGGSIGRMHGHGGADANVHTHGMCGHVRRDNCGRRESAGTHCSKGSCESYLTNERVCAAISADAHTKAVVVLTGLWSLNPESEPVS